jgi:predicted CoA-binding protein
MPTFGEKGEGWQNPSPEQIRNLLKKARTIAIVGLSSDPGRPSYGVAQYLKNQGYKIIPVNPREESILGEKAFPDLKSISGHVDIVDVFRKPDAALSITLEAIAIGADAVWLQESVISTEAFKKGEEAGIIMVMDKCIYKEHSRLI